MNGYDLLFWYLMLNGGLNFLIYMYLSWSEFIFVGMIVYFIDVVVVIMCWVCL